jgi:hypothetical protein
MLAMSEVRTTRAGALLGILHVVITFTAVVIMSRGVAELGPDATAGAMLGAYRDHVLSMELAGYFLIPLGALCFLGFLAVLGPRLGVDAAPARQFTLACGSAYALTTCWAGVVAAAPASALATYQEGFRDPQAVSVFGAESLSFHLMLVSGAFAAGMIAVASWCGYREHRRRRWARTAGLVLAALTFLAAGVGSTLLPLGAWITWTAVVMVGPARPGHSRSTAMAGEPIHGA